MPILVNQTAVAGTLPERLHAFPHVEVSGWGIPSLLCNHMGILHDDVITQLDTPPTQKSLDLDNSYVSGATCKGQILVNMPELLCYTYIS
jgi:hypothetical protein